MFGFWAQNRLTGNRDFSVPQMHAVEYDQRPAQTIRFHFVWKQDCGQILLNVTHIGVSQAVTQPSNGGSTVKRLTSLQFDSNFKCCDPLFSMSTLPTAKWLPRLWCKIFENSAIFDFLRCLTGLWPTWSDAHCTNLHDLHAKFEIRIFNSLLREEQRPFSIVSFCCWNRNPLPQPRTFWSETFYLKASETTQKHASQQEFSNRLN